MKVGDLVRCESTGWLGIIVETGIGSFKDIGVKILDSRSPSFGLVVQQATWQWEVLMGSQNIEILDSNKKVEKKT